MARPPARMFEVESLEGKQLLSTMHLAHHTAPQPPALVLDGDLKDPTGMIANNSDMSRSTEKFSGHVRGMGVVTGSILNYVPGTTTDNPLPGAAPHGPPEIVLANPKGSVTLSIDRNDTISQTDTSKELVTKLHYTVESGTGAYAGAAGTGIFTDTEVLTEKGWGPNKDDMKLHTTSSR